MATKLGEVYVEIGATIDPFRKQIDTAKSVVARFAQQASASVDGLREKFSRLGDIGRELSTKLTAPILAAGIFALKEAGEEENTLARLSAALNMAGDVSAGAANKFSEFNTAIAASVPISKDALLSAQSLGASIGGFTGDALKQASVAAIGLSEKLGIDLETAMRAISKAARGNTTVLQRMGLAIDDNLSPSEKFNQVIQQGTAAFSLAESKANTLFGRLIMLKESIEDAAEPWGRAITPAIKIAISIFDKVILRAVGMVGEFMEAHPVIAAVATAITAVVAAMGPLFFFIGAITPAIALLVAGFNTLAVAATIAWSAISLPVVAVIAAIAAVAAAVAVVINYYDELEFAVKRTWAIITGSQEDLAKAEADYVAKIQSRIDKENELQKLKKSKTIIPLNKISEEISGNQSLQRFNEVSGAELGVLGGSFMSQSGLREITRGGVGASTKQESVGSKIDETNDLLSSIKGLLKIDAQQIVLA